MKLGSARFPRQIVAFFHDLFMAAAAFLIALVLRLGDAAWDSFTSGLWQPMLLFTAVCGLVFLTTGLYRGVWRYASMNDLVAIIRAVSLALAIFLPVTFLITRLDDLPRSWLVISWFVLIFLLGAPRMTYRVFKDQGFRHLLEHDRHSRVPVLLIGAGDAAETFIREMARDRDGPFEVLGVIDEKGMRTGRHIHGVRIFGTLDDLPDVVARLAKRERKPQRLILTKPLTRDELEALLHYADTQGATVARLPRLTDFSGGVEDRLHIRPIAIEDLLGRTQTKLDRPAMEALIKGRRVLVTGAGGSIGAELVRQIAAFAPAQLTLFDNSEFNLYSIDMELAERHAALDRLALIGDVRDAQRVDRLIKEAAPDLVFHAAALKHVPLVEHNPLEGVHTNVLGTRNMADACRRAGVAAMVLVSTDKAINPPNVMGATKRLAESYCQALDLLRQSSGSGTRFVTVRFGNVLGSTGSVVPLFQRQLAAGGPLTVTDPEMTRYFMTIREAVELVLQASALGSISPAEEAGRIYVLDMGEPVKIVDLARQMIRLSGLSPDKDVEITFTGLRPGEKMHEELFHGGEALMPTSHPGLHQAAPRTADAELLGRSLDDLARLVAQGKRVEILQALHRLVPEFCGEVAAARKAAAAAS
ncbi:polysaccharide biosynthesis protein [Pelagibius litoralis]|uniref:Polysaccharide biosynthesis protein n=1 Tax=Pelagibius litoralis TaxID=374515 RepID=A0A967F113_9PROT|nr:nucleoside-diphosphate sugar epimerase/dehydratase [Pelagibius litoralis]NIA71027.1 polysaccharide biosynthesis protein [Pelagibius litoralis]